MRIKPQKHTLFTLIKMKGSLYFVFTSLFIILFVAYRSKGDPRARLLKMICDQQRMNNQTISITNYVRSMEQVGIQMQTSHSGTAYAGTGSDSSYVLVECNGDLSAQDCILCYAQARTLLTACFPTTGGQILLHGCFARVQNYNFYQEYAGPKDSVSCRNTTRSAAFQNSATQAITNAVRDAPRNKDYFARQVALSDTANESVYVMADCWGTLNETTCTKCLDSAFGLILKCLPLPVGLAFHTGCLIRYSDTNFLNPESASASIGEGNATSQVIQITCGATRANTTSFIPVFVKVMEDISLKINTSNKGKVAIGKEPYITYGLGQCYGNISTTECLLCYAIARASIPSCLPTTGGRVYLNDCFLRYESYNFFGEYTGREDKVICSNSTRRDNAFQQSVETAVHQAVETASIIKNYHIRTKALISGTTNDSVSAVADCLFTLDAEHCGICLQKAAKAMLDCLPATEGYALYTGCFMRYSGSDSSYHHQKALSKGKIFAIAIGVSSIVAFVVAFYAWKIRSKKGKGSNDNKLMKILNSSSLNFKYSTIEKSTNSFDEANKLGQGGFGTVYKGVLPDGKEVAVKRLFLNHRHRAKDFYNEVNIISSVAHKNLVKLVGFSCLGPESILIYEYLPNRSLDNFIFDAVKGKELDWEKRFDIIVGIAEGLAYLHENSKTRIIHRDIKAANILLDSRLRAKISDFGLARSFQKDKNHISTGIAGTLGYMAPEYISHGKLTEKVDVYSFGILLLEVATGMPNRGVQTSEYTHSLVSIAWKHFKQGSVEELFDPVLMLKNQTSSKIKKEIQSVIHIGLLCIQEVASLRPTMSMTLQMLSKNIQPLPSPANPPYLPENSIQLNGYGPIHRENNHASVPTVSNSSFTPR